MQSMIVKLRVRVRLTVVAAVRQALTAASRISGSTGCKNGGRPVYTVVAVEVVAGLTGLFWQ